MAPYIDKIRRAGIGEQRHTREDRRAISQSEAPKITVPLTCHYHGGLGCWVVTCGHSKRRPLAHGIECARLAIVIVPPPFGFALASMLSVMILSAPRAGPLAARDTTKVGSHGRGILAPPSSLAPDCPARGHHV